MIVQNELTAYRLDTELKEKLEQTANEKRITFSNQSENLYKVIYQNALQLKKDALLIAEKRKSYNSIVDFLYN